MPQGPLITDEVKILAAKLHREHPKWTNSMIRNEIRAIVHKSDKSLPKSWPSKYAVDRIMPEIRKNTELDKTTPDPLDRPWTLAGMAKYPIAADALPTVLRVWFWRQTHKQVHIGSDETGEYYGYTPLTIRQIQNGCDTDAPLTIREAQWVARLYTIAKPDEAFDSLYIQASTYALWERLAKTVGIDYFTTPGDNLGAYCRLTDTQLTPEETSALTGLSEDECCVFDPEGTRKYQIGQMMEVQDERSDLLQSKHGRPGEGRHKSRKPARGVSEEGERA